MKENDLPKSQIEAIIFKPIVPVSYLLLRRISSEGGYWQPVTGAVENDENISEGLLRELKEETGYTPGDIQAIISIDYRFNFTDSDGVCRTEFPFGIMLSDASPEPVISREHDAYQWVGYIAAMDQLRWEDNKHALTLLNRELT